MSPITCQGEHFPGLLPGMSELMMANFPQRVLPLGSSCSSGRPSSGKPATLGSIHSAHRSLVCSPQSKQSVVPSQLHRCHLPPFLTLAALKKSEKQISYINTYVWNLEKWYRWSYLKRRNKDTCREQGYGYWVGAEGRNGLGDWDWHIYTTMYKIGN